MANRQIQKPSPQTIGITSLLLGLIGLTAGIWYYQQHANTRTQRLKRKANRQLRRARGKLHR